MTSRSVVSASVHVSDGLNRFSRICVEVVSPVPLSQNIRRNNIWITSGALEKPHGSITIKMGQTATKLTIPAASGVQRKYPHFRRQLYKLDEEALRNLPATIANLPPLLSQTLPSSSPHTFS